MFAPSTYTSAKRATSKADVLKGCTIVAVYVDHGPRRARDEAVERHVVDLGALEPKQVHHVAGREIDVEPYTALRSADQPDRTRRRNRNGLVKQVSSARKGDDAPQQRGPR